jgi:hypothetical protein
MKDQLQENVKSKMLTLYEIIPETTTDSESANHHCRRFIATTPQTRSISNDPTIAGIRYTRRLREACTEIFRSFDFGLKEREVVVLNILRGALNFGLRDALADAYGWYRHNTSFISAQRARDDQDEESWHITEKGYKKIFFPSVTSLVMGDVVATGTSLHFALNEIIKAAVDQRCELKNIVFFTYGGQKAEIIFKEIDSKCRELFPNFQQTFVIYLEGRFTVPDINTKLSIRLTGTDLLRYRALMAPEFIESQYESPTYPLERCIIYDAGSRAFWIPEYVDDVIDYWRQTLDLAHAGVSFANLLKERFPSLDVSRFGQVDLQELCLRQINKMDKNFNS